MPSPLKTFETYLPSQTNKSKNRLWLLVATTDFWDQKVAGTKNLKAHKKTWIARGQLFLLLNQKIKGTKTKRGKTEKT